MLELADIEQGSTDWIYARLGIPTASQFKRIVTAGGKASASQSDVLGELLAECVLGYPFSEFGGTFHTERGEVLEPRARKYYEFHRDREVRLTGFCYLDEDKRVGASPDWMLDPDGIGEIKCPKAGRHLVYLSGGVLPKDYFIQVQGQLWVTGRQWCDFMSFYPELPPFIVRVERDEKFIEKLAGVMAKFLDDLDTRKAALADIHQPAVEAEQTDRPVNLLRA